MVEKPERFVVLYRNGHQALPVESSEHIEPDEVRLLRQVDVLEHMHQADEQKFLANLCTSLEPDGFAVVGTPNEAAAPHSSSESKACHVNWKDHRGLRAALESHFRSVFLFSMNDEVVHTGFFPMAHCLLALAVGVRSHPPEDHA